MKDSTPKSFALQLGSLISLYVSIGALITLLFGIITLAFPSAADASWETGSAESSIRLSIAILIIVFPAYLYLTRTVNQIRRYEDGMYLALTKWLIYLSLVAGGALLLGDGVSVVFQFLSGDITTRFVLKALALAFVVGLAFVYYLKDAKGYWQSHETASKQYGLLAALVVVVALIVGFMNISAPSEVKARAIDEKQLNDLRDIGWRIEDFHRSNQALPATLTELFGERPVPDAEDDREEYRYTMLSETSFELCAEFALNTSVDEDRRPDYYYGSNESYLYPNDWYHTAGVHCFERTINANFESPEVFKL